MGGGVRATVLQTAAPFIATGIVLAVCRFRGLAIVPTLALRLPSWGTACAWGLGFVLLIAVEEWASRSVLHLPVTAWDPALSTPIVVLRVVTMVVLAPIGEELVFRGLMFDQLSRGPLGVAGAIAVAAAVFALLHAQYGITAVGLIFVDGLFFGGARAASGSIALPIALHALGNAYAAWQRLRLFLT
jgi:uncharacterized protein